MSDAQLATPLAIVETYFDVRLDKSGLKKLDKVNDQAWIDFSHHYASVMRNNLARPSPTPTTPAVPGRDQGRAPKGPPLATRSGLNRQ